MAKVKKLMTKIKKITTKGICVFLMHVTVFSHVVVREHDMIINNNRTITEKNTAIFNHAFIACNVFFHNIQKCTYNFKMESMY